MKFRISVVAAPARSAQLVRRRPVRTPLAIVVVVAVTLRLLALIHLLKMADTGASHTGATALMVTVIGRVFFDAVTIVSPVLMVNISASAGRSDVIYLCLMAVVGSVYVVVVAAVALSILMARFILTRVWCQLVDDSTGNGGGRLPPGLN